MYRVEWLDGVECSETFITLISAKEFVEDLFFKGFTNWRLFREIRKGRHIYYEIVDSGEIINNEDDIDATMCHGMFEISRY